MNPFEAEYRKTPRNPKVLGRYVEDLLGKGRILEANFYHRLWREVEPKGLEMARLGICLGVRLQENRIAEYEPIMREARATHEQIYALHLFYYLAFADNKLIEDCALGLLDYEPKEIFTCETVLGAISKTKSYKIATKFVRYYLPKFKIPDNICNEIKRILVNRSLECLRRRC